jgi:hypothetical protein
VGPIRSTCRRYATGRPYGTSAIDDLAAAPGAGPALMVVIVVLAPVAAATLVLTWHGLRGTNPGPAATLLLKLVELVLRRGTR